MSRDKQRSQFAEKPFKEQLKDMFSLHASERRGTFLFIILLVLLCGWVVYEQWLYTPPKFDPGPIRAEMEQWIAERRSMDRKEEEPAAELFDFDPNTIGREEWRKLGLSDRQINGIFNYKEKGGQFRVKKDLAKMYTIPPETFAQLEPFILLPDSVERKGSDRDRWKDRSDHFDQKEFTKKEREPWPDRTSAPIAPLDINSADTTELVTLPGIGPAFARGIVKYRNMLGGYVSLDQLHEVYVLRDKPDAVEKLKQILVIKGEAKKIPINSVTVAELEKHPYFNRKIANGLINYRNNHGPFSNIEDIKGSVLINDSLFEKIAPYLKVE